MSALNLLRGIVIAAFDKTAAASTAGGPSARVGTLLPLVVGSTKVVSTYPASTAGKIVQTAIVAFGSSSWTQLLSSGTLTAHLLTAIDTNGFGSLGQTNGIAQIGAGAAGAEVLVASVHAFVTVGSSAPDLSFPVLPPVQWPTNERVAIRLLSNSPSSNTPITVRIAPTFKPRPI